jgi:D-alanyl-D-alanine carboxypeptidase (penicillin-binding protein 5/6)
VLRRITLGIAIGCALAVVSAAATFEVERITAPVPAAAVAVSTPAHFVVVAGEPAAIPLPGAGSLTLVEGSAGIVADLSGATVRPIGSVAKTMTALVVLAARPLQPGAQGPLLTMTAADARLYAQALAEEGSAVAVRAGERWSERDLLLALMLPSANNVAETLARWVSGARVAFIALLNGRATALGMTHTHFDDPSGFSAATVSTSRDLAVLGEAALANPTLAGIASTRSAVLPDGAQVDNLDILLTSQPGWLGIKTGWTPSAGGCLLFAAQRTYATGAAPVIVIGAVLAQPPQPGIDPGHPELGGAMAAAAKATTAALDGNVAVDVANVAPPVSGSITTPWGSTSAVRVGRAADRYVVMRRGAALALKTSVVQLPVPIAAGAEIGRVTGTSSNGLVVTWSLRVAVSVDGPSVWWKLFHR